MKKELLDDNFEENLPNEYSDKSSFIREREDESLGMLIFGLCFPFLIVIYIMNKEGITLELSTNSIYWLLSFSSILLMGCGLYIYHRYCESKSTYFLRLSNVIIEEPYQTFGVDYENIKYVLLHRYNTEVGPNSLFSSERYFRIELGLKKKIKYSFLGIPIGKRKVFLGPFKVESALMEEIKKRSGLV